MSKIFDVNTVKENLEFSKPTYMIGVDNTDKRYLSYCLARDINGIFEVLLSKSMTDDSDFEEEVENLAKYFNAEIVKEA